MVSWLLQLGRPGVGRGAQVYSKMLLRQLAAALLVALVSAAAATQAPAPAPAQPAVQMEPSLLSATGVVTSRPQALLLLRGACPVGRRRPVVLMQL